MGNDFNPDDQFHAIAFAAYVTEARACGGQPDSEAVRRRAYDIYEEEAIRRYLAENPVTNCPPRWAEDSLLTSRELVRRTRKPCRTEP